MQKIVPHLWFNTEAKEATALYTTLFENSSIDHINTITGTPSGDCDIVSFTLANQKFMAMSAGSYFKLNPAISLFTTFDNEAEIDTAWNIVSDGGTILMPYQQYPWATKYGWVTDKYGLSWQLSLSENHQTNQKITPMLMFTQAHVGQSKEAIEYYTSIFSDSKTDMMVPYEEGEGDVKGYLKHARFSLSGSDFMAMDSSTSHAFTFNEAVSLIVSCDTQEEIDMYWEKLSAVPESEQCGWCKDKFGVSWQIVPSIMNEMMTKGTKEQIGRVTQAFMQMKKFDVKTLEEVFNENSHK